MFTRPEPPEAGRQLEAWPGPTWGAAILTAQISKTRPQLVGSTPKMRLTKGTRPGIPGGRAEPSAGPPPASVPPRAKPIGQRRREARGEAANERPDALSRLVGWRPG